MKIGILTVQRAPNYGAMLQCYALQKYIISLGNDCEVIDLLRPYHPDFIPTPGYEPFCNVHKKSRIRTIRSFIGHYIHRYEANTKKFETIYKTQLIHQKELFEAFDKRIIYSKQFKSIGELYEKPPVYDVYMTGSDQLWNPTQPYCIEPFFLTFVKNGGKKVSFATSIGVSKLPEDIRKKYVHWLSDYDLISVREQEAVNILSNELNAPIHKLIDPTFLLFSSEWEDLMDRSLSIYKENYVFCFTLSYQAGLHNYLKEYTRKQGLKLVYIVHAFQDAPYTNSENEIGLIDVSPEQWLGLIYNAKEIFTDSFHGSVFSILFKKDFYSYIPSTNHRGSRIENLLSLFDLDNRIFRNLKTFKSIQQVINYTQVFRQIEEERHKSIVFLKNIFDLKNDDM